MGGAERDHNRFPCHQSARRSQQSRPTNGPDRTARFDVPRCRRESHRPRTGSARENLFTPSTAYANLFAPSTAGAYTPGQYSCSACSSGKFTVQSGHTDTAVSEACSDSSAGALDLCVRSAEPRQILHRVRKSKTKQSELKPGCHRQTKSHSKTHLACAGVVFF